MFRVILIICSSILLIIILLTAIFNITLNLILSSPNKNEELNDETTMRSKDGKYKITYNYTFLRKKHQKITIDSFDKKKLNAWLYQIKPDSHNYTIFVHGYRGRWQEFSNLADSLSKYQMNFLFIEQRGHVSSPIKYTSMGIKESEDLLCWIAYLLNIDNNAKIFLVGHSMGGFTVGLTLGKNLPSNVKCALIESSYYSIEDQYKFILKTYSKTLLKNGLVIPFVNFFARLRMKIDFKTSLKESLEKTTIPTLFIHGKKDSIVSFTNFSKILDCFNKNTVSLTYVNDEADHILSFYYDKNSYLKSVYSLLYNYFE